MCIIFNVFNHSVKFVTYHIVFFSLDNSYLELILCNNAQGAQKFAQLYSYQHIDAYDDELQSLLTLTNSKQLSDEIIYLPGNRLLKKLKQHRFILKLSQLANKLLLNYLNSSLSFDIYDEDDKQLLRTMVNNKLTISVQPYEVLSNAHSIPTFELHDYIPGMLRKSWPIVDSYMPVYNNIINKGISGKAVECLNTKQIRCPDTKKDPFYHDLVTKLIIPQKVLGLSGMNGMISNKRTNSELNSLTGSTVANTSSYNATGTLVSDLLHSSLNPSVLFTTVSNTSGKFNSSMTCCCYNDIGTRIACGFSDSLIRVWDINTNPNGSDKNPSQSNPLSKMVRFKRSLNAVVPESKEITGAGTGNNGKNLSFKNGPILSSMSEKDVDISGRTGGIYRAHIEGQTNTSGYMVELVGHSKAVYGVSQDSKSSLLVSSSADKTIRLWNTSHVRCVNKYSTLSTCWGVDFAPFGYYFCAAGEDRTVTVYSTDRQHPLRVLVGHISDVTCVKYHPNSALIATGSDDKTCRLWDMRIGNCVRYFQAPFCSNVMCIDLSPNGTMIAAGSYHSNDNVCVWDIGSNKLQAVLHDDNSTTTTNAVQFDTTSRCIAAGGDDGVVKTWDLSSIVLPSLNVACANAQSSPIPVFNPSCRMHTKYTPVFGLKYHAYNRQSILYAAGPFNTEQAKGKRV